MIVEIALGIVLAVIILFSLPFILVAGVWIIVVGLAIAVVAAAIFTDIGQGIVVVVLCFTGFLWIVNLYEKKKEGESAYHKARASYSASAEAEDLSPRLQQDEVEREQGVGSKSISRQAEREIKRRKKLGYDK